MEFEGRKASGIWEVLELLHPPSEEGRSDWPSLDLVSTLVQSVVAKGVGPPSKHGFWVSITVGTSQRRVVLWAQQAAPKSSLTFEARKTLRSPKSSLISGMKLGASSLP